MTQEEADKILRDNELKYIRKEMFLKAFHRLFPFLRPKSKPTIELVTVFHKGAKLRNKSWLIGEWFEVTNPSQLELVRDGKLQHLQIRTVLPDGTISVRCLHVDAAQEDQWEHIINMEDIV